MAPMETFEQKEQRRKKALKGALGALQNLESLGAHAVVFGSVVRPGAFKKGSDIDICILSPDYDVHMGGTLLCAAEDGAEDCAPGIFIDISYLNDLRSYIRQAIEREGLTRSDISNILTNN